MVEQDILCPSAIPCAKTGKGLQTQRKNPISIRQSLKNSTLNDYSSLFKETGTFLHGIPNQKLGTRENVPFP